MTPIEAMENVAARIRSVVKEYSTHQKRGTLPISVYAGYPPFSTKPAAFGFRRVGHSAKEILVSMHMSVHIT